MKSRREFLKKTTVAATTFGIFSQWAMATPTRDKLGEILPLRQIVRGGEKTTAFCLGGWHMGNTEDPKHAQALLERAMELGVRFYDNATVYHSGRSEKYMGQFLSPKYREQVFIMTKSASRNGPAAAKDLDASLKNLRTDYLDLWQIHSIATPEDVDNRLKEGVLDVFLEAKEKGKTRYIGFTGHTNPTTNLYFLKILKERGIEFDTSQMPLNICDPSFESFQQQVIPTLLDREYGIIAMKTMAGGSMMAKRIDTTPKDIATEQIPNVLGETGVTYAEAHQYVYTLPISSLCSGCLTIDELEHNVGVLKNLKKLSKDDMEKLEMKVKPYAGPIVENYKRVFS